MITSILMGKKVTIGREFECYYTITKFFFFLLSRIVILHNFSSEESLLFCTRWQAFCIAFEADSFVTMICNRKIKIKILISNKKGWIEKQ